MFSLKWFCIVDVFCSNIPSLIQYMVLNIDCMCIIAY
uniref:Uncharacterized protein n=1 Tax=Anguilla anguilla TaxID=7936 RepID=A0A0E9TG73_ANGAN